MHSKNCNITAAAGSWLQKGALTDCHVKIAILQHILESQKWLPKTNGWRPCFLQSMIHPSTRLMFKLWRHWQYFPKATSNTDVLSVFHVVTSTWGSSARMPFLANSTLMTHPGATQPPCPLLAWLKVWFGTWNYVVIQCGTTTQSIESLHVAFNII